LFVAWQHFEIIRDGYESEVLKREVAHLIEQNDQLKLERAFLRSPQRIDLIARKLGLCAPAHGQVVVMSSPFPSEQPATLLASSGKLGLEPAAKRPVIR
jgi:hypothetical protein